MGYIMDYKYDEIFLRMLEDKFGKSTTDNFVGGDTIPLYTHPKFSLIQLRDNHTDSIYVILRSSDGTDYIIIKSVGVDTEYADKLRYMSRVNPNDFEAFKVIDTDEANVVSDPLEWKTDIFDLDENYIEEDLNLSKDEYIKYIINSVSTFLSL